jgi:hypothetical protein
MTPRPDRNLRTDILRLIRANRFHDESPALRENTTEKHIDGAVLIRSPQQDGLVRPANRSAVK